MKTFISPSLQKKNIERNLQEKKRKGQNDLYNEETKQSKKGDRGKVLRVFTIIGLIAGVGFTIYGIIDAIKVGGGHVLATIFGAILVFGGCVLGGRLLGWIVSLFYVPIAKARAKSAIKTAESDSQTKQTKFEREAEEEYEEYLKEFNAEVQKKSVAFTGSPLTNRLVERMTNGFCNEIQAADRSKHIGKIIVPYVFKTYPYKIAGNHFNFDFNIERCETLASYADQVALAKAIAAEVQLNATMQYSKDPSGTDSIINISSDYYDDYVVTTIEYVAPNGYFEAENAWL